MVSQLVLPSVVSQLVLPSVVSQVDLPSVVSQLVLPSVVSQLVLPSVVSQLVLPSWVSQLVLPSVVSQLFLPSVVSQLVLPSWVSQLVLPSVVSQLFLPSVVSQLVLPSVVSQLFLPPVVSQLVLPSVVSQLVLPSMVSQLVFPSVVSQLVLPSVVSQLVLPSVVSQLVLPPTHLLVCLHMSTIQLPVHIRYSCFCRNCQHVNMSPLHQLREIFHRPYPAGRLGLWDHPRTVGGRHRWRSYPPPPSLRNITRTESGCDPCRSCNLPITHSPSTRLHPICQTPTHQLLRNANLGQYFKFPFLPGLSSGTSPIDYDVSNTRHHNSVHDLKTAATYFNHQLGTFAESQNNHNNHNNHG